MKSYIFKALVVEDEFEDGRLAFHASCPALKGCHTWGHTQDEALANLRDAIELYVEDMLDAGETLDTAGNSGIVEFDTPSIVVNV